MVVGALLAAMGATNSGSLAASVRFPAPQVMVVLPVLKISDVVLGISVWLSDGVAE